MIWQCGKHSLDLTGEPLVMGILNATPDSFSDGYPVFQAACHQAARMIEEGADILDVGGESTRPGSEPVSLELELERILPLIQFLTSRFNVPVSVDTRRAEVARQAVQAGAHIINHVSGSLDFQGMIPVLQEYEVGYVAMHMKASPKTMQDKPLYENVTLEITQSLRAVKNALMVAGIGDERLIFDPGIGFGKTLEHNLTLLREMPRMAGDLGRPLLMGLSRKSWLTHLLQDPLPKMNERDAYTAVATVLLPVKAVPIHRVHNVGLVKRALKLAGSLRI